MRKKNGEKISKSSRVRQNRKTEELGRQGTGRERSENPKKKPRDDQQGYQKRKAR